MHPVGSNRASKKGAEKPDSPQLDSATVVTEFKSRRHFRRVNGGQKTVVCRRVSRESEFMRPYALKFLLLMLAGRFTLDSPTLPDEGSRRQ